MAVKHCLILLIIPYWLVDASNIYSPNNDDVEVVEGRGGSYKFVEEDDVLILTRETFHYFILSRQMVLVKFYTPWCGHCKELAPEYSRAAKELKKDNITLVKVDADKEVELAKEFMITGYPTIILFRNGEKNDEYHGKRTAYGIMDYMHEKINPNWKPPSAPVMVLTSENFTQVVRDTEFLLVEFFTPWCQHCQQLEPEYETAARSLLEYGIPLAKVDGSQEKEIAETLRIPGWPNLKVFRKGRSYEYKGPRDHTGIVKHMKELARPPSKRVNSLGQMRNALDRTETNVLGFFSSESDLYNEYMVACEDLRGIFTLLHSFDEEVAAYFNVSSDTIVVIQPEIFHSEYEKSVHEYSQTSGNADDIIQFVKSKSIPLVGQRTKRNEAFKYSSRPLVVVYYDVQFNHQFVKDTQFIRKKVLQVAKTEQMRSVIFAICNEEEYIDELRKLDMADANEDIKVAAFNSGLKFRMDPTDDLQYEELKKFVTDFTEGKGKAFYKSQPIPKIQKTAATQIVADSFVGDVLEARKDVLMLFYAPWCGHCKAMEPEYNKLAKWMKKKNPKLLVAKMDATANDLHVMFGSLKGYPTIFFLPMDNKEKFIQYQEESFTYKEMKKFVQRHASFSSGSLEKNMTTGSVELETTVEEHLGHKQEL